ncbi:hypothetical protein PLESTB_000205700 [Pleodorina starrii]|uniref:N-acetyltransferase domain-containing protein n=1 Tax=Pleodorina starrii TaxID=330485 RepID=A0A9W6BCN9_9CHLO|nr:hypothetical protein PLESTM_000325800 [Pleodorina starrii]GLC49313.1 hypothetical protein PLESTB_000205700 [Pleodorina starrii]GLC73429.1 hypothetical protein PLESTF_001374500 [Pleodorina starrii]
MRRASLGRQCTQHSSACTPKKDIRPWKALNRRNIVIVASSVDTGPSTSSPTPRAYTVRRATQADSASLAAVCGESFGRGNFPGLEVEALHQLEERYAAVIEEDMQVKLTDALDAKAQAQRQHREYRLRLYMQQLRAELAAMRGEPARFVTQVSPQDVRMIQRWRRSRQFMVLVAAEKEPSSSPSSPPHASGPQGDRNGGAAPRDGGPVVACATLSLMQPEALLPPPFPSAKPFRCYVSNMAVAPSHRRRGLARRLLQQCERVARLWGHSSLWLHVKGSNAGAEALYRSLGFRRVEEGGLRLLPGPLSQVLMCKQLPPLPNGCPVLLSRSAAAAAGGASAGGGGGARGQAGTGVESVVTGVSGGARSSDGVFVWNAVVGVDGTDEAERD